MPPIEPDGITLEQAALLSLALVPQSPEAVALVADVVQRVITDEVRRRQRGVTGQESLRRAIGALVGGILRRWTGSSPRVASRSTSTASFSRSNGSSVSAASFRAARDGMLALGLLGCVRGKRFISDDGFGDDGFGGDEQWAGRVSRFWPTAVLLELADAHGLKPDAVRKAFRVEVPKTPPDVQHPVILRGFSRRNRRQKIKGDLLAFDPKMPLAMEHRQSVQDHNAFASTVDVTGCLPPRWTRVFNGDLSLGGRWYAVGGDPATVYLTMSEEDRLNDIHIGGEAVVEVDVSASHLTILHGLLGLPLPEGDLYAAVPGIPRKVVKAWLTVTLGRGLAKPTWPKNMPQERRMHSAKAIYAAMVAAYPFLGDLLAVLPSDLRAKHGDRRVLVPLFLQYIEASALSEAIRFVRSGGHLALPTHDGLLVAQGAKDVALAALECGFRNRAGISPRLDVAPSAP